MIDPAGGASPPPDPLPWARPWSPLVSLLFGGNLQPWFEIAVTPQNDTPPYIKRNAYCVIHIAYYVIRGTFLIRNRDS